MLRPAFGWAFFIQLQWRTILVGLEQLFRFVQ